MVERKHLLLRLLAVLVVAPILAAVILTLLLLLGVPAHSVFLPGFFVKAKLEALGIHAPNAVGVLATGALWWGIVVVAWLVLRRVIRRA